MVTTFGLAALTAGLGMLVAFTSGIRDLDAVVVAMGAAIASLAAMLAIRLVHAELALRERPRLEYALASQAARRGSPAIPAALDKITRELQLATTSKRYYRRVVEQRLAALGTPLAPSQRRSFEQVLQPIGAHGTGLFDRLPERLTRRGADIAAVVAAVRAVEQSRQL